MVETSQIMEKTAELTRFGKFKEANQYLDGILKKDPDQIDAQLEKIRVALFEDKVPEAFRLISKAGEKHADDPRLVALQGAWFIVARQYAGAVAALNWVLERMPTDSLSAINLGIAYRHLGRIHEAEGALLKALSLNPMSDLAHYEYSRILTLRGRYEEAMAEVLKTIRINPYFITAYMTLTEYFKAANRIDAAIDLYQTAIKIAPDVDFFYGQLATLYEQKGDFKEALKATSHLAEKNQGYMDFIQLGICHAYLREFDEAEKSFQKALKMAPEKWQAHYNLGEMRLIENKIEEARKFYKKATELVNDLDSRPFNGLGLSYMLEEKWEEAKKEFERATEINPQGPAAFMNLAVVCRNQKQIVQAKQYAERALALAQGDEALVPKIHQILESLARP